MSVVVDLLRRLGVVSVGAALLLSACAQDKVKLNFHAQTFRNLDQAPLQEIITQQTNFDLQLIPALFGESGIDALVEGRADLALVNNSRRFHKGLRAVVPVYESVLHVLVSEQLGRFELTDSLRDLDIYIANSSQAGRAVIELLASRQKLVKGDFELVREFDPQTTDLIVYFGPINPTNTPWFQAGYSLVDLGDATSSGGVEYLLPRMHSAIIPARTYDLPGNVEALRTLGVMTLLLARKEISEQVIYDLTETLIEQKPRFMSVAPSIFSAVNDSFLPLELNFPLHSGARRYLHRDEPSNLERYAELINLVVYLAILILTGTIAAYRWRAHLKRDRIDEFYMRTLALRKQGNGENENELIEELNQLEEEAFQSLVNGKLAADESFRIFTELLSRSRQELFENARRLL
jgi:hypothetical protein